MPTAETREARRIGVPRWWDAVAPSHYRGSGGYPLKKNFKNQLLNRVFSAYLQTEMVSPTVWARLSIRHCTCNCYLYGPRQIL